MAKKFRGVQRLDKILGNVAAPLCKKFGFMNYKIISQWSDIVGEKLAQKCQPIKISFPFEKSIDGTLFIEVANPGFALEIQSNESIILGKIATYFGYKSISKIKINISNYKQTTKQVEPVPIAKEIDEESYAILEKIEDERTKAILRDIAQHLKI